MDLKKSKTTHLIAPFLLLLIVLISQINCSIQRIQSDKPMVILKLDDLWYKNGQVHEGWQEVMDFLNKEKVVGTIGIVGESLEKGEEDYYNWIKNQHQQGHEIWNHGYCHCKPTVNGQACREFRGTDYTYQLGQLQKAQQLAKEKLGLTLVSFGAPYNSTDSSTVAALAKIPALKIWLYKETKIPTNKQILKRIKEVNIEYPVHIPDFQQFKAGYEKHKNEPLLVIQGHPRSWTKDRERMDNFKQIITFLKEEKVRFITPIEYTQLTE